MGRLWEVAPPGTWALLSLASLCFLAGFVLLSHTLVRRKANGDEWRGWTARGRLEWTVRGGLASLFAGGALWAVSLGAPGWLVAALGVAAGLFGGAQLYALARR